MGWAPALYLEPADEMTDTEISNVQRFPISKGTLQSHITKTNLKKYEKFVMQSQICDTKKTEVRKHRTRLLVWFLLWLLRQ